MSLMSSLYTGTSGIHVAQNAINTTAHNLANVDTKGFSRQQVIVTDGNYVTVGGNRLNSFRVGMGTSIAKVMTYRNEFYDQSYRKNNGRLGYYTAQYESITEVENLLGEMNGVAFQNSLSSLWETMQEVCKNPGDIVARANFINDAASFVLRAENVMNQLTKYQESLNTNIRDQVNQLNEYGRQLAELNKKISSAEAGNVERANDLRDQRDIVLDNLSKIVDVKYREDANGRVSIFVEGVKFVEEGTYNEMGLAPIDGSAVLLNPVWPHLDNIDVFDTSRELVSGDSGTDVGYLKGLILGRGNKQANYTDIPIEPVSGDFANQADYEAAMREYNAAVREYNKTIDVSSIMSMQAQFDQLFHGVVKMINDTLCPKKTITEDGVTYTVLDTEKAPVGMDADKSMGLELFVRKNINNMETKVIGGETYLVYPDEDPNDICTLYTIGQIEVNQELLSNYSKLALSSNNGSNEFDQKTCDALIAKWREPFAVLGPGKLTKFDINSYYTNMVGELANKGNKYVTVAESQQLTVDTIDAQRQSVAGVSSDEELTNLIRFQHAYNASSRYITVVNNMLDTLLNM